MEKIVVSGTRAIGEAVGINWQKLTWYIENKGLPAWRIDGKGNWMALPEDLRTWAAKMRDENLKK